VQGIERMEVGEKLPPVLVTAGALDERVPIWGPAKWVAAVRARLECEVYLNVVQGGHYLCQEEELHLDALEAAFLTRSVSRTVNEGFVKDK
jgi:protease II